MFISLDLVYGRQLEAQLFYSTDSYHLTVTKCNPYLYWLVHSIKGLSSGAFDWFAPPKILCNYLPLNLLPSSNEVKMILIVKNVLRCKTIKWLKFESSLC